jgi:hypothetical protein
MVRVSLAHVVGSSSVRAVGAMLLVSAAPDGDDDRRREGMDFPYSFHPFTCL